MLELLKLILRFQLSLKRFICTRYCIIRTAVAFRFSMADITKLTAIISDAENQETEFKDLSNLQKTNGRSDITKISSQPTFPLLSLPAELREQIYGYLFKTSRAIDIVRYNGHFTCTKARDADEGSPDGIILPTGILQSCRQIHHEATPILDGSNEFVFTWPAVFLTFMNKRSSGRWVRHVRIMYPADPFELRQVLEVLGTQIEKLEDVAFGGAVRRAFSAVELVDELVPLVRKMGQLNQDREIGRTLDRVALGRDGGTRMFFRYEWQLEKTEWEAYGRDVRESLGQALKIRSD